MELNNYRLHGLIPAQIIRPGSLAELAEALRTASANGQSVIPWGAGTRQHIGAKPQRYDLALDLSGLNRIVDYNPADLVITVEPGVPLAAAQALLAQHGQWLPWDPPQAARATIGGLLATGASGPLRLGYGAPRDWTLGMRVALADGRIAQSGAKVVKNVAGYDAHKLHIGALGTLGVIAEATFKVAPLPLYRQTLLAAFTQPAACLVAMERFRAASFQPISMVALNMLAERSIPALAEFQQGQPPHILLAIRFAGTVASVRRQLRDAVSQCVEIETRIIELSETDDSPLWEMISDLTAPTANDSLLLRVGAPSSANAELIRLLEQIPAAHGWEATQMLIAGVGLGYGRWNLAASELGPVQAALAELRAALARVGGYAVVEEAPARLDGQLDIWGAQPPTIAIMRRLREQWDAAGILNPGRYIV